MATIIRRCVSTNVRNTLVKRNLFGTTTEHHDIIKSALTEQLHYIEESNKNKWNFDFSKDSPLPGRYEWEIVDSEQTPSPQPKKSSTSVSTSTSPATPKDSTPKMTRTTRVIRPAVRRRPCTRSCFSTPGKPDYKKLFAPASPPSLDQTTCPQPVTRRVSPTSAAKALLVDTLAKVAQSPRMTLKRKRTSIEVTGMLLYY